MRGLFKAGATIVASGALVLALVAGAARADDFPSRPVTIVTPFAAGSVTDATARVMAKFLSEALKQPKVVAALQENGGQVDVRDAAAFVQNIQQEMQLTAAMMKQLGLQPV